MAREGTVLVVDDEAMVLELLHRQLTQLGYACRLADGGRAALEMLRGDEVDVALIDLMMPDMDGFAVLEAMQTDALDTVAVVLTSYGNVGNAVKAMKSGAFDFVEKPVDMAILESVVDRALRHRQLLIETKRMEEALQSAYRDLERKVEDRTRELTALNKALRKENQERAATEEKLDKAHREVEHLLASMSSFLIGVGRDLRINRWNAAAAIAFNLPAEHVIGKRCEEAGFPWDWNFIVKHVPGWPEVDKSVRLPELQYRRTDGT